MAEIGFLYNPEVNAMEFTKNIVLDILKVYKGTNHLNHTNDRSYHWISLLPEQAEDMKKDLLYVCNLSQAVHPDAVIHCAAWTDVDMAEDEDKLELVRAVNVYGTQNIADVCKKMDVKMTYLSTDYVFDGEGTKPWEPDCESYRPLNVYGQTKLEGELAVRNTLDKYFIVRIAWVFGKNGKNFVKTMLNLSRTHDMIRVVKDQIGTPTYTYDLARLLVDMNETEKYGCYHATNEGTYISWYDFACEIFRQAGRNVEVIPVTTEEYGLNKAARPFNSRLDRRKLLEAGFEPLPVWQDALRRYLKEMETEV